MMMMMMVMVMVMMKKKMVDDDEEEDGDDDIITSVSRCFPRDCTPFTRTLCFAIMCHVNLWSPIRRSFFHFG